MALEKPGKNVSSYPSLAMPLDGDAGCYTTLSAEFFAVWDPEIKIIFQKKLRAD